MAYKQYVVASPDALERLGGIVVNRNGTRRFKGRLDVYCERALMLAGEDNKARFPDNQPMFMPSNDQLMVVGASAEATAALEAAYLDVCGVAVFADAEGLVCVAVGPLDESLVGEDLSSLEFVR